MEVQSQPTVSSSKVECAPRMSIPPGATAATQGRSNEADAQQGHGRCSLNASATGVPVLSAGDCQCSPGYTFDAATQGCEPCARGEYKEAHGMLGVPKSSVESALSTSTLLALLAPKNCLCRWFCLCLCQHVPGRYIYGCLHAMPIPEIHFAGWCHITPTMQVRGPAMR